MQGSIYGTRIIQKAKSPSPSVQSFRQPPGGIPPRSSFHPQTSVRTSLKPQDAAAVRAITGKSLLPVEPTSPPPPESRIESDDDAGIIPKPPSFKHSYSTPAGKQSIYGRQTSVYSLANRGTGRSQVYKTELKPDLWKIAVGGVFRQISQKVREEEMCVCAMVRTHVYVRIYTNHVFGLSVCMCVYCFCKHNFLHFLTIIVVAMLFNVSSFNLTDLREKSLQLPKVFTWMKKKKKEWMKLILECPFLLFLSWQPWQLFLRKTTSLD